MTGNQSPGVPGGAATQPCEPASSPSAGPLASDSPRSLNQRLSGLIFHVLPSIPEQEEKYNWVKQAGVSFLTFKLQEYRVLTRCDMEGPCEHYSRWKLCNSVSEKYPEWANLGRHKAAGCFPVLEAGVKGLCRFLGAGLPWGWRACPWLHSEADSTVCAGTKRS